MKGAISTHILTVNQTCDQAQRQQRWGSTHDHMTFGDIQLGKEEGNGLSIGRFCEPQVNTISGKAASVLNMHGLFFLSPFPKQ